MAIHVIFAGYGDLTWACGLLSLVVCLKVKIWPSLGWASADVWPESGHTKLVDELCSETTERWLPVL